MNYFIDNNENEKAISFYEQCNGKNTTIHQTCYSLKHVPILVILTKKTKLIKSITDGSIEYINCVINFYGNYWCNDEMFDG